jgi:hypothetical protein
MQKSNKSYSCESILTGQFVTVNGVTFTASMSASGAGSNYVSAKQRAEKNINDTLANFLSSYTPKIVKETHTITTTCSGSGDCKPKLTLYYRLTISPTNSNKNYSETKFVTDPFNPDTYRGIVNLYMCNSDFVTYNTNILSFNAIRTPSNANLPSQARVPDLYNETVSIGIEPYDTNFLQAAANYIDTGTSAPTTVPYVDYAVTGATGIFKGYTKMRINIYNNGDPPGYSGLGTVRTVEFF